MSAGVRSPPIFPPSPLGRLANVLRLAVSVRSNLVKSQVRRSHVALGFQMGFDKRGGWTGISISLPDIRSLARQIVWARRGWTSFAGRFDSQNQSAAILRPGGSIVHSSSRRDLSEGIRLRTSAPGIAFRLPERAGESEGSTGKTRRRKGGWSKPRPT